MLKKIFCQNYSLRKGQTKTQLIDIMIRILKFEQIGLNASLYQIYVRSYKTSVLYTEFPKLKTLEVYMWK